LRKLSQILSTLVLSLILGTMVWFVAVREQNPPVESDYAAPIPLETENLPAGTVVLGDVPERIVLRLRAPQSSWERLSPAKFRAWIDLANLTPGLHDVPVQVETSDSAVSVVETRPGAVNIRLESLVANQIPIKVDVMDSVPVGFLARSPIFSPITATVSGPSSVVNQVSHAIGEVYLRGARETVNRSVSLSARNANGDLVSRVAIDPSKLDIVVPIEQRFGYRDVSVRVRIQGEVASGYWISNITVEPSTLTVVGGPSALKNLPGFVETSPVDVTDATNDIVERVALVLPQGVSVVQPEPSDSQSASGVQVSIQVSTVEGGQTVQRPVTFQGLGDALSAVARPYQVDVILSGPIPRLQALTLQDVQVIADLFGLGVGVHMVKPTIVVPETLQVKSVLPETLEVQITLQPSPAPTASSTSLPEMAATPGVTSTATLSDTAGVTGTLSP
jgi:YbbR domain-containing protein